MIFYKPYRISTVQSRTSDSIVSDYLQPDIPQSTTRQFYSQRFGTTPSGSISFQKNENVNVSSTLNNLPIIGGGQNWRTRGHGGSNSFLGININIIENAQKSSIKCKSCDK